MIRNSDSRILQRISNFILLVLVAVSSLSCGGSGQDFDHNPPDGFGSLIINNISPDDIEIFINGELRDVAGSTDDKIIDLLPGVYRVILTEEGGDRTFLDEIDVLEGRLTILDVTILGFANTYDVLIRVD